MLGNGAKIGMANTVVLFKQILQVQIVSQTVCPVVVALFSMLGAVVLRAVPMTGLAPVATIWDSVLFSPSNNF